MKTNKSYSKRLKVTKNGKILARTPGQNHFNAKESSRTRLNKQKMNLLSLSAKNKNRFITYKKAK
ncbi:50S ribosomal protein L35 [Candidatus Kaiserbacteria bacterium]|nr:50S ribosomal protein L35 [Candidatus Kaiserbacteria bacterium]